ncbi:nfa1 [Symbiodinium pilosum]|uniref:Nfa1 protein n=1 Tax=Symbiodinium pilosum TaxID=2952 RepID=A0A812YF61_SYMPI|nr:nfa1 [Symbiodinium pilosum]
MVRENIPSVNIPEMDEQHQELFSAVTALKDSANCVEELGQIIDAVDAHFKAEEALFEKYQIPNVITHRSEHMKFLATLQKKHAELSTKDEAKEDLSTDLEQLVKSSVKWLKIHTNAYDAPQYGTFFKDGEYIGN